MEEEGEGNCSEASQTRRKLEGKDFPEREKDPPKSVPRRSRESEQEEEKEASFSSAERKVMLLKDGDDDDEERSDSE